MTDTSTLKLLEPFFDPEKGIKNTNFFNGRILTAEDLKTDQDANRRQHEQLGRALGTGVVSGLEVSLDDPGSPEKPPLLKVTAGLALNPRGQAIALPVDITLALARQVVQPVVGPGLFGECQPPKTTVTPSVNRGIYLLVAAPASGYRERTPKRDLNNVVKISGCDSRYAVEGVQFRLEELRLADLTRLSQDTRQALAALLAKEDPASLSKLRNWLAHVCFGTEELVDFPKDPLARIGNNSPYQSYGAVDAMRAIGRLTDCDVPLALLFWTVKGVQFIDRWAVRRKLVPPLYSRDWPLFEDGRSLAEAEARFFQFQNHMDQLLEELAFPTNIKASGYFRYLPSAGFLIIAGPSPKGISATTFFQDLTVRYPRVPRFDSKDGPIFMEGSRLKALLRDALSYPAIDVSSKEVIWLYRVRENRVAIPTKASFRQTVIAFVHGQMPYYGSPRFDAAYFDSSNYSSVLLGPGGR